MKKEFDCVCCVNGCEFATSAILYVTFHYAITLTMAMAMRSIINPRLTKLFFVTRLTKGVVTNPSLDFPNRTPYETDFGINR